MLNHRHGEPSPRDAQKRGCTNTQTERLIGCPDTNMQRSMGTQRQGVHEPLCVPVSVCFYLSASPSFAYPWTFMMHCKCVLESLYCCSGCLSLSLCVLVSVLTNLHMPPSTCPLLVNPWVCASLGLGSPCLWFSIYPTSPFIFCNFCQCFCISFLILLWLCLKLFCASIPFFPSP